MSASFCIGCGRRAPARTVIATGRAAESMGAPPGLEVEIGTRPVCDACLDHGEDECRELRAQHRRLLLRGYDRAVADRMMTRRVDRYFRDGTFLPFSRRAAA